MNNETQTPHPSTHQMSLDGKRIISKKAVAMRLWRAKHGTRSLQLFVRTQTDEALTRLKSAWGFKSDLEAIHAAVSHLDRSTAAGLKTLNVEPLKPAGEA